MLFFEMTVSVVLAVKLLGTQGISALEKISCAVNCLAMSAEIPFEGETSRVMAGKIFAPERSFVSPDVLSTVRVSIALDFI